MFTHFFYMGKKNQYNYIQLFVDNLILPYYLDRILAAVDRWALTARKWVSSASADRMKPSSSLNTVTELDFLFTPNTWMGEDIKWHFRTLQLITSSIRWRVVLKADWPYYVW